MRFVLTAQKELLTKIVNDAFRKLQYDRTFKYHNISIIQHYCICIP